MNEKISAFKEKIKGKKVAVLGIGVSNIPLISFLLKFNVSITAFDKREKDQLGKVYDNLKKSGIDDIVTGENYLNYLNHDIIFKTPGIRPDVPQLNAAREKGSIITSEMELFFELCTAQIIGVTGSDGKTTTTTLIYKFLKQQGYSCWLGGNIGKPLLSEVENIMPDHKVVLELSSFQLHTMKRSPAIAVITNISPNHLDKHKSMEEYIEAKKNIFIYQQPTNKLVLNYDNSITRNFSNDACGKVFFFSRKKSLDNGIYLKNNDIILSDKTNEEKIINIKDIILPGVHNIENYLASISAVSEMVSKDNIKKIANTFTGVSHRLEFVKEINKIKFYNDSIGSSPSRTIAGLNSFDQKIVLIAGGYDKRVSFIELGEAIIKKVKVLILIGETADKIKEAVVGAPDYNNNLPIIKCFTLEEAVKMAYKYSHENDIVLLSPACASFDMFKNFEERGNKFKEIVNNLIE